MSSVGQNIKRFRKEAGLTQKELATLIGKTLSSIQKYEMDIAAPPLAVINKIAAVLNEDIFAIIGENKSKSDCSSRAERIKASIERCGLSYDELSRITNIPKSTLQRYATGETPKIPIERIEAIAKATNVKVSYLVRAEDAPTPEFESAEEAYITTDEQELVSLYRKMNETGRAIFMDTARLFAKRFI